VIASQQRQASERTVSRSETPATQFLRRNDIDFGEHRYDYVEHGGTAESARQLGIDEHAVVKTLVMQDQDARPLIVLMHGDRRVSTRQLAREIARTRIEPCEPRTAQRHSGYFVGGTSPFGLRKPMPIFVEASVLEQSRIYINGGRRGLLVSIDPRVLVDRLGAVPVRCALEGQEK
jgi:Cys-tRNA(Pro) deacylase